MNQLRTMKEVTLSTYNVIDNLHVPIDIEHAFILNEGNTNLGKTCSTNGTGHFSNASYSRKLDSIVMQRMIRTNRQHRVVGVEEGVGYNVPCLVPMKILFINENAHQLRNGKSWMGLGK
jgi:hypothetical protein